MKIGNLVIIRGVSVSFIGVILEKGAPEKSWVVHWFDDGEWTWEIEGDLERIG